MIDPKSLLDQFLGSKMPGMNGTVGDKARQAGDLARQNPIATGLLAAVLLGTRSGRGLTGSALKLGGLAAVAGLGYQAWKNYQAGQAPGMTGEGAAGRDGEILPPPADSDFSVESAAADTDFAMALVRIMIAAARADGHVDASERTRILDKLSLSGMGGEAIAFLDRELTQPIDIDGLVASASTQAQKVEMFTAARLAIDPETRAERGFLDLLAGRLGLADELIDHIDATVSTAKS